MRGFVLFFLLCAAVHAQYSFSVLLQRIENPSGTKADGTPCNEFAFAGLGCDMFVQAGFALDSGNYSLVDLKQVSFGDNRVDLKTSQNNPLRINESLQAFSGFTLRVRITSTASDDDVIDDVTIVVNTTSNQGVQSYTSTRDGQLGTVLTFAWSSSLPPSTTTVAMSTVAVSTTTQTTPAAYTGPSTTSAYRPKDCDDVTDKTNGTKMLYFGDEGVFVYCEFSAAGALTVIQSRGDGDTTNFTRGFNDYKNNFGNPGKSNNFWLGLDNMNLLTTSKDYKLEIDLCCNGSLVKKLVYHSFSVDTEANGYKLNANADFPGIGLDYVNIYKPIGSNKDIGANFTTYDTYAGDKGLCQELSYSASLQDIGGWWFGGCGANLNSQFVKGTDSAAGCSVKDKVDTLKTLGVNMRTSKGPLGDEGDDIDFVSYDRVRMAVFTFDSALIDQNSDTNNFCT